MVDSGGGPSLAALEDELDSILVRLRQLEREASLRVRAGGPDGVSREQGLTSRLDAIRRVCAGFRRVLTSGSYGGGEQRHSQGLGHARHATSGGQTERFGLRARSGFGMSRARPKNPARTEARAQLQGALDSIAQSRRDAADKRLAWALDVLGGGPGSSPDELRQCYRALLRMTHPDALQQKADPPPGGSAPTFAEVQQAWDVVCAEGLAH